MPTLKRFEDYDKIEGQWYEDKLADMVAWGVVRGFPDGTLRPERWGTGSQGEYIFPQIVAMQYRAIMQEPEKRAAYNLLKKVCIVGGGSGLWLPNWEIITNAHVVFEQEDLQPREVKVNGNPGLGFAPPIAGGLETEIIDADQLNDLAWLKVEPPRWKDEIEYHRFTVDDMKDQLVKQEKVLTGGQPFGMPWDVTDGEIRHTARYVNVWRMAQQVYGTDLATNPGNSGGPVITLDGKLAAVVNAGIISSHLFNFLIPIYHVWRLLEGRDPVRRNGDIVR